MENRIYQINDGRLWDTEKAQWIAEAPAGRTVTPLMDGSSPASQAYLARALVFYGYPLGELLDDSPEALKQRLADLDAKYLTPRTLAGLATGDAFAMNQWAEHEAQAQPLRERLAELMENDS